MNGQERLLMACYELMLLALNAGDTERFDGLLADVQRLDRRVRRGTIEARGWITKNGRHIFIDDDGSGAGGTDGGGQEGASGQSEKTVTNAAGQTVRIVDHINLTGEQPNSITQRQNAKGGIDRNYYDENGRQVKQISNHDHEKPKTHPFGKHGEHAHDYTWNENGSVTRSKPRDLNDDERKDIGDLL